MYKIHHNMHPSVINEMYVQNHNIYDYNTRQKFQLHVSKGETDLYAKGFYCSTILNYLLAWHHSITLNPVS